MTRPARGALAVALGWALGCSGLLGPQVVEEPPIDRGTLKIPVPSALVARGFQDADHREAVEDALCVGEVPVWGELEQAARISLEQGDALRDVVTRYTALVRGCDDPGYCGWARNKIAVTREDLVPFWVGVLATCGEDADRPLFRDPEIGARTALAFYLEGKHRPHREPADDGALLQATEALVASGSDLPELEPAIRELLRWEDPEAAERLAIASDTASIRVRDTVLIALLGQTSDAATRRIAAICAGSSPPPVCAEATPAHERPDHLAETAGAIGPDTTVRDLAAWLELHPALRAAAEAQVAQCGADCLSLAAWLDRSKALALIPDDGPTRAALVAYPDPGTLEERLGSLGVTLRPDRVDRVADPRDALTLLDGWGRLAEIDGDEVAPEAAPRTLRRLARICGPWLDEAWFDETAGAGGTRLGVQVGGKRFAVDAPADGPATDAMIDLVNRALADRGADLRLIPIGSGSWATRVVAIPEAAADALFGEGLLPAR